MDLEMTKDRALEILAAVRTLPRCHECAFYDEDNHYCDWLEKQKDPHTAETCNTVISDAIRIVETQ